MSVEIVRAMSLSALNPPTGDDTSWLPMMAIVVALAALVAMGIWKRRK